MPVLGDLRKESSPEKSAGLHYRIAELQIERGDYPAAIGKLRGLVIDYPQFPAASTALFTLGELYRKHPGEREKMEAAYREAAGVYPETEAGFCAWKYLVRSGRETKMKRVR